jgi:hypothetical protein
MQFPRLDYAKKSNLGVVNTFIDKTTSVTQLDTYLVAY